MEWEIYNLPVSVLGTADSTQYHTRSGDVTSGGTSQTCFSDSATGFSQAKLWKIILIGALVCLAFSRSGRAGGVVTNCAQADLVSALNRGGLVTFSCDGTISLTNSITVTNEVILGGSGHSVTISGNNATRLFNVNAGTRLTLINLTLADGRHRGANTATNVTAEAGFGGAIYNNGGFVELVNCTLTNNLAAGGDTVDYGYGAGGAARGGAVFNTGGTLVLSDCIVAANSAEGGRGWFGENGPLGDGGHSYGGAIFSTNGTVAIKDTLLSANRVVGGRPGGIGNGFSDLPGSAFGGGVYVQSSALTLSNSIVVANDAVGGDVTGIFSGARAGDAEGGALCITNSIVDCANSRFSTNTALGGSMRRGGTGGEARGGAIQNQGTLTLSSCGLFGNRAISQGGTYGGGSELQGLAQGGAIYSPGSLKMWESTLAGNLAQGSIGGTLAGGGFTGGAGLGGGIFNSGVAAITNSTLSQNVARGGDAGFGVGLSGPGGPGIGGGLSNDGGTVTLVHCTLGENEAVGGAYLPIGSGLGPALGGGIYTTNGTVTLNNSIIASSPFGNNAFGSVVDGGHNLSSDESCNFSAPGSLNNTDPKLGPLADNGGPTPTQALLMRSSAIDAADSSSCPPTDQRGAPRPSGPACDIGAYELIGVSGIARLPGGTTRLTFLTPTNQIYAVLAATNLSSWETIGLIPASGANGVYDFRDTNSVSHSHRFYRVLPR